MQSSNWLEDLIDEECALAAVLRWLPRDYRRSGFSDSTFVGNLMMAVILLRSVRAVRKSFWFRQPASQM